MITLHQAPPAYGTPSLSPFCTKLELYFKLRGLPYRVADPSMPKAPKGKIPWVELPDGTTMGDSQLVIEHLEGAEGLDAWLSPEQRATARAVRRMLEEGTYFTSVYNRWLDDRGWLVTRAAFAATLPFPLPWLLPFIRRGLRRTLHGQGTARHAPEVVQRLAIGDLEAVEALFVGPWFFGDRPCVLDCTVFAAYGGVTRFPVDHASAVRARELPKLLAFRDRVHGEHFPGITAR